MRSYGAFNYSGYRSQGQVAIGTTHAVVTIGPSSPPTVAGILRRTMDQESGEVIALVLDRVAVPRHTSSVGGWQVKGAYVTELTRDPPRDAP